MPHFLDPEGGLHFLEDAAFVSLLPEGSKPITDKHAEEMVDVLFEMNKPYPTFAGNAKLDLFTHSEQLAVVEATLSDPQVKLMYDRLLNAAYVTYEDPETEYGLQLLLDKGLITQDRKVAIVAAMQP